MGTGKREEGITRTRDERVFCEFRYVCMFDSSLCGDDGC